ncbi:MAG: hypothetical protein H7641_03590 [Candidatus Heimdallarchaeota archaeon]|nr:hypothetical protein [Candidatus Heimdallarchaeota archaeon]MCK4876645.1 hypothetical protein [Candidatus Heimdallarchaeota archaeon]
MTKRKGEVVFILLLVFFPSVMYTNSFTEASKKYSIEANQTLTLTLSESSRALFLIEVDSPYTQLNYDFEFRNSSNQIVTSKVNIGNHFTTGYVGHGEFKARFINDNNEVLVLKIDFETYVLETNDDINGYSYKNELFCWFFNTNDVVGLKQFPIQSLKKRNYFLTFISLEEVVNANLWLSYENPQENPDWSTYLTPMSFEKNLKVSIETDSNTNWLVTSISSLENVDILIVLTIRGLSVLGKFLFSFLAATIGVSFFVFMYLDPLKYRKRKVDGKSYDHQKQKYEQQEDLPSSLREVLTSDKSNEK